MKQFLQLTVMALLLVFGVKVTANAEDGDVTRRLVTRYTLGDVMGEATGITAKTSYLYDNQGRIMRANEYKRGTTQTFTLNYSWRTSYVQDGENTIATTEKWQWGVYNHGEYGFKFVSTDSVKTYNSQNQLLKNVSTTYTYDYTYNENGQLVTRVKSNSYNGTISEYRHYTYDAQGRVVEELVKGSDDVKFSSKAIFEYDDDAHTVVRTLYKRPTASLDDGSTEYVNIIETYYYDENNVLTEWIKQGSGSATKDPVNSSRKTYKIYEGNPNQTLVTSYSWLSSTGEWNVGGLPVVEEWVSMPEGIEEVAAIDHIAATQDPAAIGNVNVEFSAPAFAQVGMYQCKFVVYRDGHIVKEATLAECYDNESGLCKVVDEGVLQGEHEYYVQPIMGVADEMEEDVVWTPLTVSEIVTLNVDLNLSPVTDLRFKRAWLETFYNEDTQQTENLRHVVLAWTNPEHSADDGFVKNEIWFTYMSGTKEASKNTFVEFEDGTVSSADLPWDSPSRKLQNFYIVSHYANGNVVVSEKLPVNLDDVDEYISNIVVAHGVLSSWSLGNRTTTINISEVNADEKTATPDGVQLDGEFADFKCGASAGNKYFAFLGDDYGTVSFNTINFTTGKVVTVNDFSYGYGKPGSMINGMAYNAVADVLYGMEQVYVDEIDDYMTALYSVDQTNGSLTELTRFEGSYTTLACSNDGKLYLIQNADYYYPNVYEVGKDYSLTKLVENTEVKAPYSYTNSAMVKADGKGIYYVASSTVLYIDLEAKTIEKKGELANPLYGMTASISSEDGETVEKPVTEESHMLVSKTYYGDYMGYVSTDVDMKKDIYFYNTDNKVARIAEYGRTYNDLNEPQDYELMYYTKNSFDEFGNMTKSERFQYGLYDFGDMALKKVSENTYEYNSANQLVSEIIGNEKFTYEYDEEGNIVVKTRLNANTGNVVQKWEYFDFIALNKPTAYVSTSPDYESYNYTAAIVYDENGNKASEVHMVMVEDPESGGSMPQTTSAEGWSYEGTTLRLYTKYYFDGQGQPVPELRITYTDVDGDPNKVKAVEETYFDGSWYRQGTPIVSAYQDFSGMFDMTVVESNVEEAENGINNVNVSFTVPNAAYSQACRAAIYRDGKKIVEDAIMNLLDFESFTCQYTDEGLKNGEHDYFIQPLIGSGDELDPENMTWTGYYISTPQAVELNVELPAVTDLSLVSARKEMVGTGLELSEEKYGTISWVNPTDMEDYGFISNELYFDAAQIAEATTDDATATQLEGNFYMDQTDVYVLTRYKYGKAFSETITVALADLDRMISTGISNVVTSSGVAFTYNDRIVTLNDNANVTVFAASGARALKANGTSTVDLRNLAPGTYVICVEKNGKTNAYKVNLK